MKNDTAEHKEVHIQSIVRATKLLELLATENREMSLTEIAKILSWPKTTAFGVIATLRDSQYIDQSHASGHYRLGVKLFELGNTVARSWDIRVVALPAMKKLKRRLGETVQLATESGGRVLYIEKLDSTQKLRIVSEIGARLPMHCTGLGKVLLAYKTPPELDRIITKHGLAKMTEHTITDFEKLKNELLAIRNQGFAIDDREIMDSLRCIAAPIYSSDGNVAYAISVACLAGSLEGDRFDMVREELLKTADEISYMMGNRRV